ncbi:response regulator transcription factor [Pseudoalteromonas denitrificans]|uniref:Response regulator receiver domain-containing protein n=1 Tax=Pseudoalteromonas denitrificans DSM 6059 TaxID=1123010 RepID=A0A1I1KM27_9GAMM|nr:response regulator [Pseudoalteromonas denitrificans]SFC61625.1 Response regulator receiver domain-containing protein [Pseudoalteromonas denitrificans DSM 6059]
MGKELSVLIVDDCNSSLLVLKEVFSQILPKSNLLCFQNSEEAMETLALLRVDILVTDLVMPNISGYELLSKAKEINNETIGILVTAGDPSFADMNDLLACGHSVGANYCIRKTHFIADLDKIKDEVSKLH